MDVLTIIAWTVGLLAFMVVLMVSIGLHEAGHMAVAKAFKLRVPKFFIGFGPTLWSKKTEHTNYGFKLIPLGGFVEIEDGRVLKTDKQVVLENQVREVETKISDIKLSLKDKTLTEDSKAAFNADLKKLDEELKNLNKEYIPLYDAYLHERGLLSKISPWKRIFVFIAGPAVNVALGFIILVGVLMSYPSLHVGTSVEAVNSCSNLEAGETCGAAQAGLMEGDKIVAIDGNPVEVVADISPNLDGKDSVTMTVERNGVQETFQVAVVEGMIGINLNTFERSLTFPESMTTLGTVMVANVEAISKLPSKLPAIVSNILGSPKDPEAPSSIVSIGKTYGDTSASSLPTGDKVQMLLTYSGLLNIGLGLINLAPFLPLDGGRIAIALMDSIKILFSKLTRRAYNPVGVETVKALTLVMVIPVITFMGLLIVSDVLNISRGWM